VDSIEYAFLFNTGDKQSLTLPYCGKYKECSSEKCDYFDVQYEKHKKENDIYIASYRNTNIIDTLVIQQINPITMGYLDSITGNIIYSKRTKQPIVGMAFISQFDWIIDSQKGKIYAKKIKETQAFVNPYHVSVFDTSLRISLLPVGETEYELFSIIDSVNGEKVNAENICQMRELLNKKDGFKNNQIVILPPL